MLTNIMKWGPNIMKMAQHNEVEKKGPQKLPLVAQFLTFLFFFSNTNIMRFWSVVQATDQT